MEYQSMLTIVTLVMGRTSAQACCDKGPGWASEFSGFPCYYFSEKDTSQEPVSFEDARKICEKKGRQLAVLGKESASDVDPVLAYFRAENLSPAWIGANLQSDGTWRWFDGRILSVGSTLWHPGNPSGDGTCVEANNAACNNEQRRTYLNDLSCTEHRRHFVCETNGCRRRG